MLDLSILTLTMDVLGTVGTAYQIVLRDTSVHPQAHVTELPLLAESVTRYAECGGVHDLPVVFVFTEL